MSDELVTICFISTVDRFSALPTTRCPQRTPMDLQAMIGLGLLTLVLGTIAVMGTHPENRVPYALHITLVTSLAYIVSRLT